MTVESGEGQYATNPPQEPIFETEPSAQGVPETDLGAEPPATPAEPPATRAEPPATTVESMRGEEDPVGSGATAEMASEDTAVHSDQVSGIGGKAGEDIGGAQRPLVGDHTGYTRRWESVQVGFVDDPRAAVQEAEFLVSEVMDELISAFQRQRQQLEQQEFGGNRASTDDLRAAFQRYRSFFQRLLNI